MKRLWTKILVGMLVFGQASSSGASELAVDIRPLELDEPVERRIEAQEAHRYRLPTSDDDTILRLILEQRGIELLVEEFSRGASVGSMNHHRDRVETEIFRPAPSVDVLVVRPVEGGEPAGEYRLELTSPSTEDPRRLRLEQRLTEASRVPHGGETSEVERAAQLYEGAASDLERPAFSGLYSDQDFQRAAALLNAANHRRVLRQSERATELYAQAVETFRRLDRPAWLAAGLVGLGQAQRRAGQAVQARETLAEALELWRNLGDRGPELATTQASLGLLAHVEGDLVRALELYDAALDANLEAGRLREAAAVSSNLSNVQERLGDATAALDLQRESLETFRALGDRRRQMGSMINLAELLRKAADPEESLKVAEQARRLAVEIGDQRSEGRILNNRGYTYLSLGQLERAQLDLSRALELRRQVEDVRGQLFTLANLGECAFLDGRWDEAAEFWRQALGLGLEGDQGFQALISGRLTRLQPDLDPEDVRRSFDEARLQLTASGDRIGTAMLTQLEGQALLRAGRPDTAVEPLTQALRLWRDLEKAEGEILTLIDLADAYRRNGGFSEAAERLSAAIDSIERMRLEITGPNLRATFLASRYRAYEAQLDTLVALHDRRPNEGFLQAAVETADRARNRRLLDVLTEETGGRKAATVAPDLWDRHRRLTGRLSLMARQLELAEQGRRKTLPEQQLRASMTDLKVQLDLVDAELRRRDPTSLHRPVPLSFEQIQSLLDPETNLLVYALGREASHLFVVGKEGLSHHLLPPRDEIEAAARLLHRELASPSSSNRPASGTELAQMILAPAQIRSSGKRLAVLPDGALHYVPFAALPLSDPSSDDVAPLIQTYEVTRLPSVAVLAADRRNLDGRDKEPLTVAVLADPVFDLRDARFQSRSQGTESQEAPVATLRGVEPGPAIFGRLPGSLVEAEAIAAHIPKDRLTVALGFGANRRNLMESLSRGRVLHLATHGLISTSRPELSGLVLSQFHSDGRRRADGFLRLRDISELSLEAELVVLSGCRTALGKELRGEAFQGLAGAFLQAGARRVMASLWPVADRATATLMDHFYRELLEKESTPAAALQRAQLAMAEDRRYRDPFYWAGFVLQGDWR